MTSTALAMLERDARAFLVDHVGARSCSPSSRPSTTGSPSLGRDDVVVLVATIDEVVVAYLELVITGATAVVRQVYVEPEAREVGFGDDLLATAIDIARSAAAPRSSRPPCRAIDDQEPLRAGRDHDPQAQVVDPP